MATLTPGYFETTIAQDMSTASSLASETITVANGNAVPTVTGGDQVWAWIGNANVEASLEAVLITAHTAGSTSVTITRGADDDPAYPPNTHEEGQALYGPALLGSFFDALPTEDAANFTGTVRFTGVISPTALSAATNDWNPTGLSTANVIRASATGAARNLTGIVAQESGRELRVENIGSQNIVLKDADTGSSAANRFDLTTDHVLLPGAFVVIKYDGTTQRWRATPSVNGVIFQNFGTDVTHAPRVNVIGDLASATYNAGTNAIDLEIFSPSVGDITDLNESDQILKSPVRVATTGALTLATGVENGDTIDGVTLATNDRVLIKDQASGAENGIYRVNASGAPTRTSDADSAAELPYGFLVVVKSGTTNANTLWQHTTTAAITLNTTALTFAQKDGGGGGSMSSFTLAGDSGTQTINDGNTLTVAGGAGLVSAAGATDTVTLDLDINSLTADGSPSAANDYVATWDASASAHKKVLLQDLPGGGGGSVATDTIWDAAGDMVQGTGSNTAARTAIGSAGQVWTVNSGATAGEWQTRGIYSAFACIQDEKAAGTNSGGFTSGAWRTRDLNTEQSDAAGIATVSSNQITLTAGTYDCLIFAPAYYVNAHKARLYNVTDSALVLGGTAAYAENAGNGNITHSVISGRFTIAGSKALEVQHQCGTTRATDGFGTPSGFSQIEVYVTAMFWKVA